MKNKGSKKLAIWFTSFCMLIFSCLYVASNIYIIIVDGWDYLFAFCVVIGTISVVLWSINTSIELESLRELKNMPREECAVVDDMSNNQETIPKEESIYDYYVNLRYYDKKERSAIYELLKELNEPIFPSDWHNIENFEEIRDAILPLDYLGFSKNHKCWIRLTKIEVKNYSLKEKGFIGFATMLKSKTKK